MLEENPYFRDSNEFAKKNLSNYKYKSDNPNINFNKNPYEDAFLNRFSQWMVLPKRKKLFFILVFSGLTLAMMPLAPHLNLGIMFYISAWSSIGLVTLIYKVKYNTQCQKYIDFENKKHDSKFGG